MGEDEKVVIDVAIQIDEAEAREEAKNFVDSFKPHLQKLKEDIGKLSFEGLKDSTAVKGAKSYKAELIQRQEAMAKTTEMLAEMVKRQEEAEDSAKRLSQVVSNMGRVMKGQSVKGYEGTTAEDFEKAKVEAKQAKDQVNAFAKELSKVSTEKVNELNAEFQELYDLLNKTTLGLKVERGVQASELRKEEEAVKAAEEAEYNKVLEENGLHRASVTELNKKKEVTRELTEDEQKLINLVHESVTVANKEYELSQARVAVLQDEIAAKKKSVAQSREEASRFYYLLRAVKMAKFAIDSMGASLDNFGKKSISGLTKISQMYLKLAGSMFTFTKILGKSTKNMNSFKKSASSATKAHNGFVGSLKKGIWTILKYGLGIRSLYFLFRKLRSALVDGIENLAKGFDEVNKPMSSIVTSLNQMKNAIAAAVQPLISVLAPVLEKIAALFSDLAVKIASFFAAFTGQKFVFKAIRYQIDYADSLDKTKKKAKEAKKELSSLDKLNVLHSNKDDNNDDKVKPIMFEKVPIDKTLADWAKKFKDFLKRLAAPIKRAWDKEKDFVIKSWKYALDELKKLWASVARDFWRVWEEPTTQKIFENIFHTIGDIGLIVGHLARNFRKAWDENENGYRILRAIRNIIYLISDGIRRCADLTVIWADKLSFLPLMNAIADVMEKQIVPAIKEIIDLIVELYGDVVLELGRYVIEELAPVLIKAFGNIAEAIGTIAFKFRMAWREGKKGKMIVNALERLINVLAYAVLKISELTKEWAKELNFNPLLEAIYNALNDKIIPATYKVVNLIETLYDDVVLELAKYIINTLAPKVVKLVGNIAEIIGNLADNFRKAWNEGDRGKKIMEELEYIFNIISNGILDLSEKTAEWAKTVNFAPALDSIRRILVALEPVIDFIVKTVKQFYTRIVLPFTQYLIEKALPKIASVLEHIKKNMEWDKLNATVGKLFDVIRTFLEKYGDTMLLVFQKLMDKLIEFVNSGTLDKILDKAKEILDNVDPDKLSDLVIHIAEIYGALRIALAILSKFSGHLVTIMSMVNVLKQLQSFKDISHISKDIASLTKELDALKAVDTFPKLSKEAGWLERDIMGISSATEGAGEAATVAGGASLGTIALVIAAIVAVIAVIVTLWKTNDEFRAHITEIWTDLKNSINESMQGIVDSVNELGFNFKNAAEMMGAAWKWFCGLLAPIFEGSFKMVADMISGFVQMIAGGFEAITGIAKRDTERLAKGLVDLSEGKSKMAGAAFDGIATAVQGYSDKIKDNKKTTEDWSHSNKTLSEDMELLDSGVGHFSSNIDVTKEKTQELVSIEDVLSGKIQTINTDMLDTNDIFANSIEPIEGYASAMETTIPEANEFAMQSMSELTTTASETAVQMETEGQNVASGFTQGVKLGLDIGLPLLPGVFGTLINAVRTIFAIGSPSKVFDEIGRFVVQGFVNGILALAQSPVNAIKTVANSVINAARAALSPSKLVSIGKNLLSGLANGIRSGISNAVGAIRSAAGSIIGAARSAFQVHSPSKIFEGIGEMLTEGLAVGVEKDTDDVENAFDGMVPDNAFLDMFYEKFTGMLSSLREESVNIVSNMIDEIEATIARMDNLAMLEDLSTKLSNISEIRVPDIATGTKLPENEKFAQQPVKQTDLSNLPAMLKSAFVEAFMESGALQNDDGDIIIQLNGNEIFREMRNENNKYRKQHGVSAFA